MKNTILNFIGKTPIVALTKFAPNTKLFAKIESKNPLGSVKDRAAFGMIRLAEKENLIQKGDIIVEATSGNTGIGLAWIGRMKGYKVVLTMPDNMSLERRKILSYLGAEIVLTPSEKGMKGAIEKAQKIATTQHGYLPDQFSNPGNPQIHYETTGPEFWDSLNGDIDVAIFGVGTGGTLSGTGKFLKEKNPYIKIIAVEPNSSPVISGGKAGSHGIQGIGAGFIPKNLDTSLIDQIEQVTDEEAIDTARELTQKESLFVGISSGAAACAARKIAMQNPEKTVVTLLPDTGERYLSTDLFNM